MTMASKVADQSLARFPAGIPFIVGNEICERFSYYGMRAILWVYMVSLFTQQIGPKAAENKATAMMHIFMAGVYAFPMIGAIIADRLLGKYHTILWISLIYCVGHLVLALFGHSEQGLYWGLSLIALGSGGIKPCVTAVVGDQFTKANAHLIPKAYQIFYFAINFGSFFSSLLTPFLYKHYGSEVAFGIPGILMGIATLIFWLGRRRFVRIPPAPGGMVGFLDAAASVCLFLVPGSLFFTTHLSVVVKLLVCVACLVVWAILFSKRQQMQEDQGFIAVFWYALRHQHLKTPGMSFFDVARGRFSDEVAEGPRAVLKILVVFSMVCVFWALFDQHASSWINQASKMDLHFNVMGYSFDLLPSQIQAFNPIFVMIIIALLNGLVYPILRRIVDITPLRKMSMGMFFTSFSFVLVALIQRKIDFLAPMGQKISVLYQIAPYLVLTLGEVLVSSTGYEFAYTQAPKSMKSTIMGFWLLTVTMGNLLVAFLAGFKDLSLENFFWTFAAMAFVASCLFAINAYFYRGKTYLH